jgi:2-amino-4-hydroxy-6-hydroxymethyldihydropteridine diphosphokinase
MAQVFLLLGSNLGDRHKILSNAKDLISARIGIIKVESSIYESDPWGFEHENVFLNEVVILNTEYSPESVLKLALDIESELGRVRSNDNEYTGRLIDIDILFYDDRIVHDEHLKIPHPLLHERRFTLQPLVEIAPDMIHPVLQKTMKQLLDDCPDNLEAKQML